MGDTNKWAFARGASEAGAALDLAFLVDNYYSLKIHFFNYKTVVDFQVVLNIFLVFYKSNHKFSLILIITYNHLIDRSLDLDVFHYINITSL